MLSRRLPLALSARAWSSLAAPSSTYGLIIFIETGWARTILLVGANWNNGSQAGLGTLNANNVASNSNRNIGARLELTPYAGVWE